MPGPSPRKAVYEQLGRIGKAIASPPRLELLDLLCQAPRTVEALAREAGLSIANTSQHLRVLHAARLVQFQKDGLFVTYSLADEQVCDFYRALRTLAENRLAEIEGIIRLFNAGQKAMEPVDRRTLLKRVRRAEVTVLDVRPSEEYRAGHIRGAISVPLKELKGRLSTLPRDREIVAYCRGPYCVLAVEAVKLLRSRGFAAARLADGVPEWRARGLPVAVGEAPR
jgi:rhodanese-related sulfurtransferase